MTNRDPLRLGGLTPSGPVAAMCGIEQEFYVFRGGERVDFREVIHTLAIPGAPIDPGDRNAYRMEDGSAITADGREAEFASIPVDTVPGFAPGLAALTARHFEFLCALLPDDLSLRGAATHINVSVPSSIADGIVLDYVQTFGPMLQALWDRPVGEGVMIRPRPGRIEFGGEFIAGTRLAAVALFCVASVARLSRGSDGLARFRSAARPSQDRLGVDLRRPAYAEDFYQAGRSARLARIGGRSVSLASVLAQTWKECRPEATVFGAHGEVRILDRVARGDLPLGIEGGPLPPMAEGQRLQSSWQPTTLVGWSRHDGTSIRPKYDTWDFTVMQCERELTRWLQVVPRHEIARFNAAANDSQFTWPVPSQARSLVSRRQLFRSGTYTAITDTSILLPLERAPGSGWRRIAPDVASSSTTGSMARPHAGAADATPSPDRPGKWLVRPPVGLAVSVPHELPVVGTTRTRSPSAPLLIALALILLVGIGVVTVVALGGGGDDEPQAAPADTPPSESTSSGVTAPTNTPAPTNSPTVAGGVSQPTPSATSQAGAPSPTTQAAPQPTETPIPEPTIARTVVPTPTPGLIIITTQLQFTQIIISVTGACGGAPPVVGQNLSPGSPTAVVIDWTNHTIKVGDSQVSLFDPNTNATTILYGTGDQRQTTATLSPNGLNGTSSFYPYWNIPAGASCFVTLSTNAVVIPGQPLLFP